MYSIVNVLESADTYDLISVDDFKTALKLTGNSEDPQLGLIISAMSGQIADMLNRVLAYEKVKEDFYNLDGTKKLFLSRWPVNAIDIDTFTYRGDDILLSSTWKLEEDTGIIYMPSGYWSGDVSITYSGGYRLPDQTPNSLRQASFTIGQEAYYSYLRGDSSIRSISHKGARVMYFAPNQLTSGGGKGGGEASTMNALKALLGHYTRHQL